MTAELARRRPTLMLIAAIVISVVAGATVTYSLMRAGGEGETQANDMADTKSRAPGEMADMPGVAGMAAAPADGSSPQGAAAVTLSRQAVERAGIVVAPVVSRGTSGAVRIPAVVEPNAYREVVVTPVVAGRITRVTAQLGDQVRRGHSIAQIYSPQLADAQTRYLSARAELEAAAQQLRRTERLVEIGAASQQELEAVRADHTTRATNVEGARSQLVLLGMTPAPIRSLSTPNEISSTTSVPAPIDGVITKRTANIGQNVDPATELFTVVDLSTVWIVGDLYEKDFRRVRVGSAARITTTAYPDTVLRGTVSYIDPELNPDTRTARVRVEIRNPDRRLRLGMFADMQMNDTEGAAVPVVPRSAVQTLGRRTVVYVVDAAQPGRFIERAVTLGDASGDTFAVLSGVTAGEVIVTEGSFFVRAERERLHPVPPPRADGAAIVKVTEQGFEPSRVTVPTASPVTITFVRTTDNTCAKEIVVASQNVKRELPLNQPVTLSLKNDGNEIAFTCGINMFKGAIVMQR